MKTSHTPGPWKVEAPKGTLCAWRIENHTKPIAFVAQIIGSNEEENANARLIASAPELLETLQGASEDIQAVLTAMETPDAWDRCDTLLGTRLALISKIIKATKGQNQ